MVRPDIAGKGIANPTALLLATAMMLEHVNQAEKAIRLRSALTEVLQEPATRTVDLGGKLSTDEYVKEVKKAL